MNQHQNIIPYYESVEFNVNDATTNYDVASSQATFASLFGPTKVAKRYATKVVIRTNNTVTVKLNDSANMAITIASTDSPFVIEGVEIRNLFITNNSGGVAAIKLLLQDSPY